MALDEVVHTVEAAGWSEKKCGTRRTRGHVTLEAANCGRSCRVAITAGLSTWGTWGSQRLLERPISVGTRKDPPRGRARRRSPHRRKRKTEELRQL